MDAIIGTEGEGPPYTVLISEDAEIVFHAVEVKQIDLPEERGYPGDVAMGRFNFRPCEQDRNP